MTEQENIDTRMTKQENILLFSHPGVLGPHVHSRWRAALIYQVTSLGPHVVNFCGKPHSNVWLTIGLAFGIFRQPAYTQKTGKFSDFCASNQINKITFMS